MQTVTQDHHKNRQQLSLEHTALALRAHTQVAAQQQMPRPEQARCDSAMLLHFVVALEHGLTAREHTFLLRAKPTPFFLFFFSFFFC